MTRALKGDWIISADGVTWEDAGHESRDIAVRAGKRDFFGAAFLVARKGDPIVLVAEDRDIEDLIEVMAIAVADEQPGMPRLDQATIGELTRSFQREYRAWAHKHDAAPFELLDWESIPAGTGAVTVEVSREVP